MSALAEPAILTIQELAEHAGIQPAVGCTEVRDLHPTDFYDALTLTLVEVESLTAHLVHQLEEFESDDVDPFALSLIARHLNDKHARLREQATAWQRFDWQRTRQRKGGRTDRA